jgi:uridine kinase
MAICRLDCAQLNFDHPDSLDSDLMIVHLRQLQSYVPVEIPVYDFRTHSRTPETRHIEPQPVILVEGILIFADKRLREMMDVKIFVDCDADLRFIRRLQRDIEERDRAPESVINQYREP